MSVAPTTSQAVALRHLEAVGGRAGQGSYVELRYRLRDTKGMGQLFEPPRRLRALATRAVALGRTTDVYVGCAPRRRRSGGRSAVEGGWTLWVDCDGDAAADTLETFEPKPPIVVASGSGRNCHAYWPLDDLLERDQLEQANRRLAHALGADARSAEAARVLRVAGTQNHKHRPAVAVEPICLEFRRFKAADVVGGLADPPSSLPDRSAVDSSPRGDDPLLRIPPSTYVERLLTVEVPRHRKVRCPFHTDHEPSLHVYETPDRGWYCFGCGAGGSIYDLAAPLYGHALRGRGFLQLRAELGRLFGSAT